MDMNEQAISPHAQTVEELKRLNTQVAGLKVDIQQMKDLLRTIANNTHKSPFTGSSYQGR